MIDYGGMPFTYWKKETVISYIQRQILVYSYMYYELNESCLNDPEYDKVSKKLVEMQNASPEVVENTQYYYCMYDYDGSTGFDLFYRLNKEDQERIKRIAYSVLKNWKGERND